MELQVVFCHITEACFSFHVQRSKKECQAEAAVRFRGHTESNRQQEDLQHLLQTLKRTNQEQEVTYISPLKSLTRCFTRAVKVKTI